MINIEKIAKAKGIPCDGYVDCIVKTGREGIITAALANKLRRLADLRNSLIHRYWIIKPPSTRRGITLMHF